MSRSIHESYGHIPVETCSVGGKEARGPCIYTGPHQCTSSSYIVIIGQIETLIGPGI